MFLPSPAVLTRFDCATQTPGAPKCSNSDIRNLRTRGYGMYRDRMA